VTLTELTIVMVLASLVMTAIVGFYLNSQATWMDASAQAITQREATTLTQGISDSIHVAGWAVPSASNDQLDLFRKEGDADPFHSFWWDSYDSLLHEGPNREQDHGAMGTSTVERFVCTIDNPGLVRVTVQLRSAERQRIMVSTSAAMINRQEP